MVVEDLIARLDEYASSSTSTSSSTSAAAAQQLSEELLALQSIYGDDAFQLIHIGHPSVPSRSAAPSRSSTPNGENAPAEADAADWTPGARIRLALTTAIDVGASSSSDNEDPPSIRLALTLPPEYPHSASPPQLQLLGRYIGAHAVDHVLFGAVLRCFFHHYPHSTEDGWEGATPGAGLEEGVHWTPGEVVLFEGVEWAKERVTAWYNAREEERLREVANRQEQSAAAGPTSASASASAISRTDEQSKGVTSFDAELYEPDSASAHAGKARRDQQGNGISKKVLVSASPLTDRKSVFIGHAVRIDHPDEVPQILSSLLSDKRISRATHPAIFAWVCKTPDGIVHRDNDDDGESAAGGRLAHLLSVLELTNVLIIVTRYYGGIHLGPDRFKLINRAARDALEVAAIVDPGGGGSKRR